MMRAKKLTFFIVFLAAVHLVDAQPASSVTTIVEKKRILLGEPFVLTIEAKFPVKTGARFPMPDTIAHFEFLEAPVVDSVSENGIVTVKGRYKLTSFDSGHWVIPSFSMSGSVRSDTTGIDVLFSEFDPEQPYHDIKDIIEVKPEKKKKWWWYAAAGALLLAAVTIYVFRRKKPAPVVRPASDIDPYEEALYQLEQLQKTPPGSKEYHSRLTNIFRLYVFRKKGILSLQKTTDDLVLQLKDLGLPREDFEKLTQSLRLSDFVKFAKFSPTAEDDGKCYSEILKAIKTIQESEVKVSL